VIPFAEFLLMKQARIDIGSIRREQIVEAAVAVITEQGLQNLSLSEIEKKAGMSRGQLTYYFPAKEDILLAVFDRLLQLSYQRIGTPEGAGEASGWDWARHLFEKLVGEPPLNPQFGILQYTFLSQIGHREDFRRRLATLYEEWRSQMAAGLEVDLAASGENPPIAPRALATVIQALLHGLGIQAAADPQAFDRQEVLTLCLDMVGSYLRIRSHPRKPRKSAANNGQARNGARSGRHRPVSGRLPKGQP
jgi:AcrR family transcriptional regulator